MYKRIFIFIFIALIITLTGCKTNDYTITTFKKEPMTTFVKESEAVMSLTTLVYHKDGFIYKTELIQETVLINGNMSDLKLYSDAVEETFKNEVFDIKGFDYSSKLTDKSFTFTTTYNYTNIDIKQVLEDGKELYHVKDVINENYRIPYDILVELIIESGFVCEDK